MYPLRMVENFEVSEDLDLCLSKLEENPTNAVIVSREYVRTMHQASQYYCFGRSDIIYEYALKMLVQKNFLYLNELNRFIKMSSENGLIGKWRTENNSHFKYNFNGKVIRQLRLENAYGFLIMYAFQKSIIILLIFLEKCVYKKANEPNPSRFWLFIEMLIDPDRHFWNETKWI